MKPRLANKGKPDMPHEKISTLVKLKNEKATGRNRELVFNRHQVSIWEGQRALEQDGSNGCTTM